MNTLKFKTNIKCSGCVATSTPYLNETAGEKNWEVNTSDPNKILTVSAPEEIDEKKIISAVEAAGFKAERIFS